MSNNLSNIHPKNQHYVPQFLLRKFSIPSTDSVFCFNKKTRKEYISNIRSVASEDYFYDLEPGDQQTSFEKLFGEIENKASVIISSLIKSNTIRQLSDNDKITIAAFVIAQHLRTKAMRSQIKGIDERIKQQLVEKGVDLSRISNYQPFKNDDEVKSFSLYNLKLIEDLIPSLLNKKWFLTKSNAEFWLSDNPVVLCNNMWESKIKGNIGFELPGIEIYLPISSCLILGFLDNQTFLQFEQEYNKRYSSLTRRGLFDLQNFVNCIKRKIPIDSTPENVEYYNSLQLMYSSTSVFSCKSNFELAKSIMEEKNGVYERKYPKFN